MFEFLKASVLIKKELQISHVMVMKFKSSDGE